MDDYEQIEIKKLYDALYEIIHKATEGPWYRKFFVYEIVIDLTNEFGYVFSQLIPVKTRNAESTIKSIHSILSGLKRIKESPIESILTNEHQQAAARCLNELHRYIIAHSWKLFLFNSNAYTDFILKLIDLYDDDKLNKALFIDTEYTLLYPPFIKALSYNYENIPRLLDRLKTMNDEFKLHLITMYPFSTRQTVISLLSEKNNHDGMIKLIEVIGSIQSIKLRAKAFSAGHFNHVRENADCFEASLNLLSTLSESQRLNLLLKDSVFYLTTIHQPQLLPTLIQIINMFDDKEQQKIYSQMTIKNNSALVHLIETNPKAALDLVITSTQRSLPSCPHPTKKLARLLGELLLANDPLAVSVLKYYSDIIQNAPMVSDKDNEKLYLYFHLSIHSGDAKLIEKYLNQFPLCSEEYEEFYQPIEDQIKISSRRINNQWEVQAKNISNNAMDFRLFSPACQEQNEPAKLAASSGNCQFP